MLDLYRKAIVLAAVAAGSAAAAWTAQGWRKDKALANMQASHAQTEVRRTRVALEDWNKATLDIVDAVKRARAEAAALRVANKGLLARVRAGQPQDPAYACRKLPLPEPYLDTVRSSADALP